MTTKLSHINYAFSSAGLNKEVADKLADMSKEALSKHFSLDLGDVQVSHKARLAENAPFLLTCYASRSASDGAAMAEAAKVVLPLVSLAKAASKGIEIADSFDGKVGGKEAGLQRALGLSAAARFGVKLSEKARAWVRLAAQYYGVDVERLADIADSFNEADLAAIDAACDYRPYAYVRVVSPDGAESTVSLPRADYARLIGAAGGMRKLNNVVRVAFRKACTAESTSTKSKAVHAELVARYAAYLTEKARKQAKDRQCEPGSVKPIYIKHFTTAA